MLSKEQIAMLDGGLDAASVSKRPGGGGTELSYIEGHYAIDEANRIFGYDGWAMEVLELVCLGEESEKKKRVAYRATVSIIAGDTERQDVGFGDGSDKYSLLAAHELACKEAVTDAMKRALRTFGNRFGNSLYQKDNPLHKGGTDAKGKKSQEEIDKEKRRADDSAKLRQTLHTALLECKTLDELNKQMKDEGFRADAKSLLKEDYDALVKVAGAQKGKLK